MPYVHNPCLLGDIYHSAFKSRNERFTVFNPWFNYICLKTIDSKAICAFVTESIFYNESRLNNNV